MIINHELFWVVRSLIPFWKLETRGYTPALIGWLAGGPRLRDRSRDRKRVERKLVRRQRVQASQTLFDLVLQDYRIKNIALQVITGFFTSILQEYYRVLAISTEKFQDFL